MVKPTSAFLDPELGAFLFWYTKEAKSAQILKAAKLIKWNMIVPEGTQPPLFEIWTTDNEAELERLKKKDIKMEETEYSRLVVLKNKELTVSLGKSTKKERYYWRVKIELMDVSLVSYKGEIYVMDTSNAGEDGDKGA